MEAARQEWESHRETIRVLSRVCGISLSELARRMSMSRQTMNGRINGHTELPPWELAGFAVALDVPVEVLYMHPHQAVQWVLDNRPSNLRNTCYAQIALFAA